MSLEADKDLSIREIKNVALKELEDGARPASQIKRACWSEHHVRVDIDKVWDALGQLRAEQAVIRLDDPNEWYQLADWDERPTRVLAVSHHITKIEGVNQLEEVWLNESIRAARYEHGIQNSYLQPLATDDDRRLYLISTAQIDVLNQYRDTLRRLSRETRGSNEEKAEMYERLADATSLEDQWDRRDEVVVLRDQ